MEDLIKVDVSSASLNTKYSDSNEGTKYDQS